MAKCDEGYLCAVCGRDVSAITESALYLRFVLGEVPLELLHRLPECHIACDAALAQYVSHPEFPPVPCEGPFDKRALDPDFVRGEEARVTRAFARLLALPKLGLSVPEYPLSVTPEEGSS
jgi:hypothetical protein